MVKWELLGDSPVRTFGAKTKTHPPVFINLFGVNNSPGSDFDIFGDVPHHWIPFYGSTSSMASSLALAATRACASISGSACNQRPPSGVFSGGPRSPAKGLSLKGGVQGIRD